MLNANLPFGLGRRVDTWPKIVFAGKCELLRFRKTIDPAEAEIKVDLCSHFMNNM